MILGPKIDRTSTRGLALILPALVLLGPAGLAQHADTGAGADADRPGEETAPVRGEDYETPWPFLSDKYDADGDGRIDREEYDRSDDAFARLDKDGSGAITEEDLAGGGGVMSGSMMASMTLRMHFQDDDDGEVLARAEVESRFAALDTDGDERLTSEEFDRGIATVEDDTGMGGMMQRMQIDRFGALAGEADRDDDLLLSRAELLAYFDALDTDDNGVLAPQSRSGRRGGRGGPRPEASGRGSARGTEPEEPDADTAPNAVGQIAPDFTLKPSHGDGEPVTLSSFAGKQPVALIFGSYT